MKKYLNILINVLIAITIIAIIAILIKDFGIKDNSKSIYNKGLELYQNNDYQNAYYNFAKIPRTSKYYSAALFRKGMCGEQLGDKNVQAVAYENFANTEKNNKYSIEALYKSAQANYELQNLKKAEKLFYKLNKEDENSEYVIASNYYLAKLSNNSQEALKYYIKYIEKSPQGRFANDCIDEILKIQNDNFSEDENLFLGKALYANQIYDKAELFLEKSNEKDSWLYRSKALIKLNNTDLAINTLKNALIKYSDTISKEDAEEAIELLSQVSANKTEILNDIKKETTGKKNIVREIILYKSGDYKTIANENLTGEYAADAIYKLLYDAYEEKSYLLALGYAQRHINSFNNAITSAKVLYYTAKIYEKLNKKIEYNQTLNRLISQYPDTYWAFRAYQNLHKRNNEKWYSHSYKPFRAKNKDIDFPIEFVNIKKIEMGFFNKLLELEDYELVEKYDFDNLALRSWINYKQGNTSLSIVQARDFLSSVNTKPDFQDDFYMLAYPILYEDLIDKNSRTNNLDGFLIAALIREESYYNPKATSAVGAIGLMQIMPATANYIAASNNIPTPALSQIYNPETNIELGTVYYKQIKSELNNYDILAILAYNGGPNAVKKWYEKNQTKDIDDLIEHVPYAETQNYIYKVYRTYWNYLNVYNKIN